MAYVVITATDVKVDIDFGVYSTAMQMKKTCWSKDKFSFVLLAHDESCVKVRAVTGLTDWSFDQAGVHGAIVENINGEILATNLDLYNKIRDTL